MRERKEEVSAGDINVSVISTELWKAFGVDITSEIVASEKRRGPWMESSVIHHLSRRVRKKSLQNNLKRYVLRASWKPKEK